MEEKKEREKERERERERERECVVLVLRCGGSYGVEMIPMNITGNGMAKGFFYYNYYYNNSPTFGGLKYECGMFRIRVCTH